MEKSYQDAITSTYDVLNFGIKDNVVDGTLLKKLQQDTFLFSVFKANAQLTEAASRLLLDDNQKIRPWESFKQEVLKLHQTYNANYLEAEYEFAKQSSIMADKWQRHDDDYLLQYRTASDERVRESHEALHDTTLPKQDPFWSHYYPPNGWRCRCTTVSVRSGKYPESDSADAIKKGEKATSQIGKDGKNKLEIFRFNPGKEQVVFPKDNTYSKVVGADKLKPVILTMFSDAKPNYKEIKKELYKNLIGKSINRDELPFPITFNKTGIKEALNQNHDFYAEKNKLLGTIDDVLKEAKYEGGHADNNENPMVRTIHIFSTDIGEKKSYIIVREMITNEINFYSISDSKKVLENKKRK